MPELAMSEVTRSIFVQTRTAHDETRTSEARNEASLKAERLAQVHGLHARGDLVVADLTDEELGVFAQLTATAGARAIGLRFRIHPGEAACIAVGLTRNHVVVTDDGDALRALEGLRPGHTYERCRKLLVRAAEEGLVSEEEANNVHAEMCRLGFRAGSLHSLRESDCDFLRIALEQNALEDRMAREAPAGIMFCDTDRSA